MKSINAIILAAGRGGRFGYPKIYAKLGEPLFRTGRGYFVELLVNKLHSAGIMNVSVVTFPNCETSRFNLQCEWITNNDPDRGMLSSIYEGIVSGEEYDGYLIIPVDHPFVNQETFIKMKEYFENSNSDVLKSCWNHRTGHPVIISNKVARSIPSSDYEGGLNRLIIENKYSLEYVDVEDQGILTNINSPEDLEKAIKEELKKMKDIEVWRFISDELKKNKRAMLLVVVNSEGSSPGRVGFKMGVSVHGNQFGTIGGGNVEHTFYQESLYMLKNGYKEAKVKRQIHNDDGGENSSGMTCSGEQTILFYPLFESDLDLVNTIIVSLSSYQRKTLKFTPDSFEIIEEALKLIECQFESKTSKTWNYKENLFRMTDITIIGAGHVCLGLSETLSKLGFYIRIVDNREDLELMNQNKYAHEKIVMSYEDIAEKIEGDADSYFVIMTHSHEGDGLVLKQMIDKEHKYLGMLGSPPKVKEIYEELEKQGVSREKLRKVHAPIGIPIKSKTVEEISISIAAELIKVRNEK